MKTQNDQPITITLKLSEMQYLFDLLGAASEPNIKFLANNKDSCSRQHRRVKANYDLAISIAVNLNELMKAVSYPVKYWEGAE